jgi:hypothetical protein
MFYSIYFNSFFSFHLEHFTCVECGLGFGPEGYHEKDGLPYCRRDYLRLFGPKCKGCKNPVKNRFITALGATWDPDCFCCSVKLANFSPKITLLIRTVQDHLMMAPFLRLTALLSVRHIITNDGDPFVHTAICQYMVVAYWL